jgi:plasmid stabilization system protein ParE
MAEHRLTPAAEHDLEMIWKHTLQLWGAGQADRYTDRLTAALPNWHRLQGSHLHVTTSGLAIAAALLNGT